VYDAMVSAGLLRFRRRVDIGYYCGPKALHLAQYTPPTPTKPPRVDPVAEAAVKAMRVETAKEQKVLEDLLRARSAETMAKYGKMRP
jgi:hypothetical protein